MPVFRLQIFRLPLDMWNLIPRHPAITFLGLVTGENQAPAIKAAISARVSELRSKESSATTESGPDTPKAAGKATVPVTDIQEHTNDQKTSAAPRTPSGAPSIPSLPRLSISPANTSYPLSPGPASRRSCSSNSQGHDPIGDYSPSPGLASRRPSPLNPQGHELNYAHTPSPGRSSTLVIRGRQNTKTSPSGTDRKR